MKIQAINNNTNFKGLFTDKSSQNNGNWKMEYSPYSWEKKNNYEFGPAEQKEWDVYADRLPDNEKRYTEGNKPQYYGASQTGREYCRDILGTEFYYQDFDRKVMRNHISNVPAMNREDSLRVLDKKLYNFLDIKYPIQNSLESSFRSDKHDIEVYDSKFRENSKEYDKGYFSRCFNKDYYKGQMHNSHTNSYNKACSLYDNAKRYITLRNSIDAVNKTKAENLQEIKLLEEARKSGRLIDISRRDIYDPNRILWEAMHNVSAIADKFVALPHKTISVSEILRAIGQNVKSADIPAKAIEYVDRLISSRM